MAEGLSEATRIARNATTAAEIDRAAEIYATAFNTILGDGTMLVLLPKPPRNPVPGPRLDLGGLDNPPKPPRKIDDDVLAGVERMAGNAGQPAAKHWDWDHIFDAHAPGGLIAAQRNRPEQVFQGLSHEEIKAVCLRSWAERKKVETQAHLTEGTRVRYQGTDPRSGLTVEFWFVLKTRTVETAYPLR